MKLFEAKWKWYKERTYEQFGATNDDIEKDAVIAEEYDAWMKERVEFMYDYMDFDNDRTRVRTKFLNEMHKKTTVRDIGEKLDEFVLSSKASIADSWDMGKHILEEPKAPTKDRNQADFDWYESIVKTFDPKQPNWLDDES